MPSSRFGRRSFLFRSSLVLSTGCLASKQTKASKAPAILAPRGNPVVVASSNGHPHCTELAYRQIAEGKPVVEAVVAGVNTVENDPEDLSVGYGGLPNEEGVVELDSSVMDGASGLAGAVAAIQNIKNPSQVALKVLRHTDHCLLVGEGARRFARAHGFEEEDLLTETSREVWLYWKSTLSDKDDWFEKGKDEIPAKIYEVLSGYDLTGTINCDAVDMDGNIAGVTTTSGLAFKIPGRVGDSPLIGAGLFLDNDVGAAGSTGRGEANIVTTGSAVVVEAMRQGMHPKDACVHAAKRVAATNRAKRLQREDGKPNFNVKWYAVNKKGEYGGGSIWSGGQFAVADGKGSRVEDTGFLYERDG
jgi:N4-(beta-N-acetylglucosaminyl)-L-asparaginase